MRALITCHHLQRHFDAFRDELAAAGIEPVLPDIPGQQLDAADMARHITGCDAVIAGDDVIDADVLCAGAETGLKAVIKWGIGTDAIDKQTAKEQGIPVYNTPGVFGEEVADLALSYLLLLMRRLHLMHQSVLEGGWLQVEGRSVHGKTAGIVGLGSIGQAIARRCRAFGMRVLGTDVRPLDAETLAALDMRQLPFEDMLAQSDVVILACNLTPENRHMMNADTFARMRAGSWIINVGRGPLIDEKALIAALDSGHLAGAGLDVFEEEPLPMDSPLRQFDNCVFGTHSGSNTQEAVARINRMTVDILLHVLGVRPDIGFTPNRVA